VSDLGADLRRQIAVAGELQGVVRTMRALAASRISEVEQSVQALAAYAGDVERGLGLCLRGARMHAATPRAAPAPLVRALVFGSDQGLVGPFNDAIVQQAARTLAQLAGPAPELHAVGERVAVRLDDAGLRVASTWPVPGSVDEIGALVTRIQLATEAPSAAGEPPVLHVFHNRPMPAGLYEPAHQQLLPLDDAWAAALATRPWPGERAAEAVGPRADTLRALLGEHLFVGLVRACAESLASENAARLAAMQRAEKNIGEVLQALQSAQRRARQERIDEELFDLLAGYQGLQPAPDRREL
jgi:F-type H+-transporting ATPase subunit gamma